MGKRKVVVIGIDGGEISVFKKMIAKGIMPNLGMIMQKGFVKDIDTYVKGPGQGWASFMTGKSPEKHGIFYWTLYKKLVNSHFIKDKLLWKILGENGLKSCVINMSYTHPPKPFNGFMISGLGSGLSASDSLELTYPDGLMDEIIKGAGNYIPACDYTEGTIDVHLKLLKDLIKMTEYRTKACLYIMGKYEPDFVLAVFRGADLIQHCYWNLIEPDFDISEKNKPLRSLVEQYYQELDKGIAELFKKYEGSANIIVSDHGFGPVKAIVYLNNYLEQQGILSRQEEKSNAGIDIAGLIKAPLKSVYLKVLKNYKFFKKLNQIRKNFQGVDLPIDKNKTLAYSDMLYGVTINTKSPLIKDSVSIKKQVVKALKELKDPMTNKNIMHDVYQREDSYAKDIEVSPDIIFEPDESYQVTYEMPAVHKETFRYMNAEETAFFTGSHRKKGVLIIDGLEQAIIDKERAADITDVFSTVLHLFDISIPNDIDGKPLLKTSVL